MLPEQSIAGARPRAFFALPDCHAAPDRIVSTTPRQRSNAGEVHLKRKVNWLWATDLRNLSTRKRHKKNSNPTRPRRKSETPPPRKRPQVKSKQSSPAATSVDGQGRINDSTGKAVLHEWPQFMIEPRSTKPRSGHVERGGCEGRRLVSKERVHPKPLGLRRRLATRVFRAALSRGQRWSRRFRQ
jgi:hypothetical protein